LRAVGVRAAAAHLGLSISGSFVRRRGVSTNATGRRRKPALSRDKDKLSWRIP
jgi:hypothetical protein